MEFCEEKAYFINENFNKKFFENGSFYNEYIYISNLNNQDNIISLKAHGKGPINIALIKYWGKEDEKEIIPLNNSISITLDMNNFYTDTYSELILDDQCNQDLYLNGVKDKINNRVAKIINYLRDNSEDFILENESLKNNKIEISKEKLMKGSLKIISRNTFPTAAGCASSASSMAILVKVISSIFNYKNNKSDEIDLSALARLGSGSACRSIYGGFSEWVAKLHMNNVIKSVAVPIANEDYWKELNISLLVVSHKKKDNASTDGMKLSKETSLFLKHRVENILPERLIKMKKGILDKDFDCVAELIMKDSNNFHAVCRDTFPTISYLNETSEFIIKCVLNINNFFFDDFLISFQKKAIIPKFMCAYSFDAGPNAFIFYLDENKEFIRFFFENIFDFFKAFENNKEKLLEYFESFISMYFKVEDIEEKERILLYLLEKIENLFKKLIKEKKENNYTLSEINNFKSGRGAYLEKNI